MEGGLALSMLLMAISPPNVVLVLAQVTTWMAAEGAAALAHSASSVVSTSSLLAPGSKQLLAPVAGAGCNVVSDPALYCESPKVLRKVVQSEALYRLLSSTTAIV